MLGTDEYNNEIMRANEASMICDKSKELKPISPLKSELISVSMKIYTHI